MEENEHVTAYIEKAKIISEIEYFYWIKKIKKFFEKSKINMIKGFTFLVWNSNKDIKLNDKFDKKLEENFEIV